MQQRLYDKWPQVSTFDPTNQRQTATHKPGPQNPVQNPSRRSNQSARTPSSAAAAAAARRCWAGSGKSGSEGGRRRAPGPGRPGTCPRTAAAAPRRSPARTDGTSRPVSARGTIGGLDGARIFWMRSAALLAYRWRGLAHHVGHLSEEVAHPRQLRIITEHKKPRQQPNFPHGTKLSWV